MISATEILRMVLETYDQDKIKLLWHLHSFTVDKESQERYRRELREWFPDTVDALVSYGAEPDLLKAAINYFEGNYGYSNRISRNLEELLYRHMERSEKEAREKFYQTNIGRAVWETLEWCLEERRPCFVEGLQGRGKSESARAWCDAHRGQARYATLDGFATQREFFSALSKPYGAPHLHSNAPTQIRYRIQDIIVRSGLTLIIDEAHFALPERTQHGRPAIIDWINTALCNHGIPVALISTPQFAPRLSEFENRTTYNADQFKRRFSGRWCKLDENTSEKDLIALAQRALPSVGEKGVELAVRYASGYGRDVSAMFDLVRDAERRARKAGHESPTFRDLRDAYTLDRVPNENALASAFSAANKKHRHTKPEPGTPNAASETDIPRRTEAAPALQLAGSRAAENNFATGTRRQQIEQIQTANQ